MIRSSCICHPRRIYFNAVTAAHQAGFEGSSLDGDKTALTLTDAAKQAERTYSGAIQR
jgi:hypothetical protein